MIHSGDHLGTGLGNILALDLGSYTGWALKTGKALTSGVSEFRPGRHEGGGMQFLRFRAWLFSVLAAAGKINSVYYEEVRAHAGTTAAHVYGGFLAVLTAWCEEQSIPYSGVPVGTIKKHATRRGNAKKPEMVAAVQRLFPTVIDDNEADALALLHFVYGEAL